MPSGEEVPSLGYAYAIRQQRKRPFGFVAKKDKQVMWKNYNHSPWKILIEKQQNK